MDSADFFQGLISGIGVLLGFTLASQVTILSQVFVLWKENSPSSHREKSLLYKILSWFFTFISSCLSLSLWIFHLATAPGRVLIVENAKAVNVANWIYVIVLILITFFQISCSVVITFPQAQNQLLPKSTSDKT